MSADGRTGRRTGVRVQIPPTQLDSRRIFSARALRLPADEVAGWNARNRRLLELYGLEVASVIRMPLAGSTAGAGLLQTTLRDRLVLTAMLGALSVSVSGRGDLLSKSPAERDALKKTVKENNDRNSTAAMTESLYAMTEDEPGISVKVAIGEGARLKPGEKGGNPTLYSGQVIGSGPRQYSLAVDTVEGTTKSTIFDHSCGTLLYATEATIAPVPDIYFDKCQLSGVDGVTVADPLERIVEAVCDARGTRDINLFALDRPRHPIDRMVALGASMRVDTDGDAYPVVASGLSWGVFPDNLRPLDGVAGNIGGAAEMIASAAGAAYLGVRSTARFAASKIRSWEERYDYSEEDERIIRSAGFEPGRVYRIEDLVPGLLTSDGAFVAAAISDNWHVPCLNAVFAGGNFATVTALFVGASGTADLYSVAFAYREPLAATVEGLTPILTRILGLPVGDIRAAVASAVAHPARARRLRHETETSYYMHIKQAPGGRIHLDMARAAASESAESVAYLEAVTDAAREWFA